jgi:hypothetical protein
VRAVNSAKRLLEELELLVAQLEDFVEKALIAHRDYCEKLKTRDYTVEKCTTQLARALLPVVRGYIERNIYSRAALLAAVHRVATPDLAERAEKTLVKLRKAAKLQ